MIGVHARYRGRDKRRAEIVARSAEALATLPGVGEFETVGVEDIRANVDSPEAALNLVMALLSDGNWAIGLGISAHGSGVYAATDAVGTRPAQVKVGVDTRHPGTAAEDISAAFALIGHVLHKRTIEGREATSLVRRGMNQNEAARQLGISKQAMSQRLQAAGWQAEQAGWRLLLNLVTRADADQPAG
ncbi:MarR family transcriptional regulator [Corynebacterium aquatimens]|uniref:MarR family transcriptional regulator n=1 Tax=Corynebacterium TaxID=1716 RepID=UPI001F1FC1BC|nr:MULTISPECIES: MarR family transcriptional regulator [Corynebacterium]QYH19729.1 MarR family transcriptional regulator [Corynebacterium aquatimens]UIZ93166.1 MarR family transcriptional regulator [Corynebacterium sp. CNCTC7651]